MSTQRESNRERQTLYRQDKGTVAFQIYELLLQRIMEMELKPLDELSEARLAAEYGVSRTPVREAFARLARRNLVDIYPQRGTFVSPISVQRVARARFIRESLECPLSRLAAEGITEEIASLMEREIALQRTFARLGDDKSFLESDDQFHALIARAAGFESIWEDVGEAKLHMDRIRRLSLLSKTRMRQITDEHGEIFAKMKAHDPEAAEQSTRSHLRSVFTDLSAIRDERPELFFDAGDTSD